MRRYTITVNDRPYALDVEEVNADTFRVRVDDRWIDVRVDDHEDLAQAAIAPQLEVRGGARAYSAEAYDNEAHSPEALVGAPDAAAQQPAAPPTNVPARRPRRAGALTAPMPGVVLSVQASPGQQVAKGDPVLVLEAMKMENVLRAPADGRVAEVLVAAGDQVKYGDPLVRFGQA